VWENYLLAVGAITILVVMFAPRGIAGAWNDLLHLAMAGRSEPPARTKAEAVAEEG
jgi:branched-chain amino acid transport system permease protein